MKILMIGNEGFIGSYVSRSLIAEGHEVVGLDIVAPDDARGGYLSLKGDILSEADVTRAAQGVEMVINLAAKHHDFGISREDFFLINETGTRNCLACLSRLGIKRLVFFSTVAVYGAHDFEADENTLYEPCNDYGESKLAGERLIEAWAQEDPERQALVVRPVVVYGPRNYANMFRLIDNIYLHRFVMVGSGGNCKATAYVENLADAVLHMIGRMGPGVERFNYCDLPHRTALELANIVRREMERPPVRFKVPLGLAAALASPFDLLAKVLKRNLPITSNRIRKFGTDTLYASKKVRALGFKQRVSTEEGLKRMVAWYLKEGRLNRRRCAAGPKGN